MLYSVLDESLAKLAEENKLKAQKVKDKQGRERFHGAFTGGFSAGYYNTVSTPEGSNSLWLHLKHLYLQYSYKMVSAKLCLQLEIPIDSPMTLLSSQSYLLYVLGKLVAVFYCHTRWGGQLFFCNS